MGESSDFVRLQDPLGVAVPSLEIVQFVSTFGDHTQVGVQRNTDGSVKGDLECSAHALSTDRWYKLLTDANLCDFLNELLPLVALLLRFALCQHLLLLLGDWVSILEDFMDFRFVDLDKESARKV